MLLRPQRRLLQVANLGTSSLSQDESAGDDGPMEIDDDAELSALMRSSWHANDAKE